MADVIGILALIIMLIIVIYVVVASLRIVRPTEKGLVERFGKYQRFVQGGITFHCVAARENQQTDVKTSLSAP